MGQIRYFFVFVLLVLTNAPALANAEEDADRAALRTANTTTNTDNNGDGTSDGNAVTFAKDAQELARFNTHVSAANLRGSLADMQCISAMQEACSEESYFLGGNIDLNAAQLSQNIGVLAANTAAGASAGDNAFKEGAAGLCNNVPTAFGCMEGDLALLDSARDSALDAIQNNVSFLPSGKSPEEFLASIDSFKQKLSSVQSVMAGPVPQATRLASLGTSDPEKMIGPGALTYEDYARGDLDLQKKATFGIDKWVGPRFLENMSAQVEIENSLSVVDPSSGKQLSLFQRATRRYQNFDLSRARSLAQTEEQRNQVANGRVPANLNKSETR